MTITGLDPNTQLGASGQEGRRAMTPSEAATILTTVMVFLLIVSIIFYCRYLASRRRDLAEATRKAAQDFGRGFYKLDHVYYPESADHVQKRLPAHIPDVVVGLGSNRPDRHTPEAPRHALAVRKPSPVWTRLWGQRNAGSDRLPSHEEV